MGEYSPKSSVNELKLIEEKLTDEILKAMSASRLENVLHDLILRTPGIFVSEQNRIKAKRFDRELLAPILGSLIHGVSPLLKYSSEVESENDDDDLMTSKLELKLSAGGASERIIRNAKELRANASIREAEILSSGLFAEEERFNDVQLRLQMLANAIVEQYDEANKPAKIIWKSLLNELDNRSATVDPNRLYFQDAFLLLGAICELSDQCKIDWGVPLA
jgi:hypothetical protein